MNKIKILLVDDDPINNFILKNKFNIDKSVELLIYESPEDAIDFLKNKGKSEIDIILLDINMPVMDGWNFLTEMDYINSYQKVIFVTSSIIAEHQKKAMENNRVVDYFIKPLDIKEVDRLLSRIKEILFNKN